MSYEFAFGKRYKLAYANVVVEFIRMACHIPTEIATGGCNRPRNDALKNNFDLNYSLLFFLYSLFFK